MNMIELVGGVVLGAAAGIALKDKITGDDQKLDKKQKEVDSLYAENEKFSKRNKEMERQIEDLLAELNKLRKKSADVDDDKDDLEDELDKAKRDLRNVKIQNDDLAHKLKEYKAACEAQEAEIASLKQKLG